MKSLITTPEEYFDTLPMERVQAVKLLRDIVVKNLPVGFVETIGFGMLAYVVPRKLYPPGYHTSAGAPLPFINIASQKNFVAMYHLGIYADPKLLEWFTNAYIATTGRKPDIGKSCIRFKKLDAIPFELIGELASKVTPEKWISLYEANIKSKS